MAIIINLYKTSKKVNSTYQPETADKSYSCVFKAPTTILAPDVEIVTDENPTGYNYAYIPEFSRRYWVANWTSVTTNVWVATLKVDVLGSYKSKIGALTQYIVRAAAYSGGAEIKDTGAIDTTYPVLSSKPSYVYGASNNNPFDTTYFYSDASYAGGTYIVGITSPDGQTGGVSYVGMDYTFFKSFCSKLLTDFSSWNSVTEITEELAENLINPFSYIVSCIWLPLPMSVLGLSRSKSITIYFGYWNFTVSSNGYAGFLSVPGVTLTPYTMNGNFSIPRHPQYSSGGARYWLNLEPFAQYTLVFYPFGVVSIPPAKLAHYDKLYYKISMDIITGMAQMRLYVNDESTPIDVIDAQVGVNVALSSTVLNTSGLGDAVKASAIIEGVKVVGNAISDIGANINLGDSKQIAESGKQSGRTGLFGLLRSGDHGLSSRIFGATGDNTSTSGLGLSDVVDNIKNSLQTSANSMVENILAVGANIGSLAGQISTVPQTRGEAGTMSLAHGNTCCLYGTFFFPAAEDVENRGRPVLSLGQISSYQGFLKVDGAHAPIEGATVTEQQAIEAFLSNGFYYE